MSAVLGRVQVYSDLPPGIREPDVFSRLEEVDEEVTWVSPNILLSSCVVAAVTWEIQTLVRNPEETDSGPVDGPVDKLYVVKYYIYVQDFTRLWNSLASGYGGPLWLGKRDVLCLPVSPEPSASYLIRPWLVSCSPLRHQVAPGPMLWWIGHRKAIVLYWPLLTDFLGLFILSSYPSLRLRNSRFIISFCQSLRASACLTFGS